MQAANIVQNEKPKGENMEDDSASCNDDDSESEPLKNSISTGNNSITNDHHGAVGGAPIDQENSANDDPMAVVIFDPNLVPKVCVDQEIQTIGANPIRYHQFAQIVESILSVNKIEKVNESLIERIIERIQQSFQFANKMGIDLGFLNYLVVALMVSKFDKCTRALWNWDCGKQEPTPDLLVEFLTRRKNNLDPVEDHAYDNRGAQPPKVASAQRAICAPNVEPQIIITYTKRYNNNHIHSIS